MWKKYINIIKERDLNYTHEEYCLWFSGYFSYKIYPLEQFKQFLECENGELLPISKNITNYFKLSNIEAVLNLIYHLNNLNDLDFLIMKTNEKNNISYLFNPEDNNAYFCNVFSYDPELLLSENNNKATLLFLFLFFLPQHEQKYSLYHPIKKIPLISCNKVTLEHFKMLLFLMKSYHKQSFDILCKNYNLTLILLEDFCNNSQTLYFEIDKEEWFNVLPIDKIKILFNENCMLTNFLDFKDKSIYYSVPSLIQFVEYFQKELEFLNLKDKLSIKNTLSQKVKLIKI